MLKIKKEQQEHSDQVRNEGLENIKSHHHGRDSTFTEQEVDLEIEAPGAANKVAEEGSLTIQDEKEFLKLKS